MTMKPIKNSHALFVSTVAAGALGNLISAPGSTLINIAIEGHFERVAEQHHMAQALYLKWTAKAVAAEVAAGLLTRHEGPRQGRRRRPAPYVLGISGSGAEGEAQLFEIMAYFEEAGTLMAMGDADPAELSAYLGAAPRRWRQLLGDLHERSPRSLDGNRHEQLVHAIVALDTLIGQGDMRRVGAWRALRLTDEQLSAGADRETVVRAVIQNPNLTPSPVPALRIAFQTHDGVPLGHWLVFPSDDVVPAMGEIQIRGRLAWPAEGVPRGVAFVRSIQDFDGVGSAEWRFPGPGGETQNID